MRVLLTGGSGMYGRATAQMLLARGDDVTLFQRRPAELGCREVLGDITDRDAVSVAAAGVDAIVHLAARVSPTGSRRDFDRVNVEGTAHVLAAARRHGVGRVVHISSPSVAHVGTAQVGAPASRADPAKARSEYSRSKARAELIALAADGPDLAVVAVRPHLVWGPGDQQLVSRVVDRARSGRLRIVGSGASLVDMTYVDNAAAATVAALDRIDHARGRALVVSNGEPQPIIELIRGFCRAAGVPEPTGRVPLPAAKAIGAGVELVWAGLRLRQDPPMTRFLAEQLGTAHWFDQRTTRALLDWEPHVSHVEGLERLAGAF